MRPASIRLVVFLLGLLGLISSFSALIVGVTRARNIEGYLEQADAALPFVRFGIYSAVLAVILCLFGKGEARVVGALFSCLLLLYWGFIGVTLY